MEDADLARIRGYVDRIKTLSDATDNDAIFADSLKKQRWILVAASEASADDGFRAICVQLQHLIQDTDTPPEQIRHYVTELINRSRELALRASHERRRELFTLTWWTAVASLSFTVLAILFGDKGIVRVIQELVSTPPPPPQGSPPQPPAPIVEGSIALLHVVLILIFLYFHLALGRRQRVEDVPSGQIAREALKQFRRGWMYIWLTYLALYIWLTICWFNKGLYFDHQALMWSIADVLNIANAVAFFYCFLVLDKPSVTTLLEPDRPRAFHLNLLGVAGVALILCVLTVLGRIGMTEWLSASAPFLGACFTALSMAFLFGRFDSHYMDAPRLLLVPLYFYVVIQLSWGSFSGISVTPGHRALFFGAALLLKVVLFWIVTTWLRDGSLRKYLDEAEKFFAEKQKSSQSELPQAAQPNNSFNPTPR